MRRGEFTFSQMQWPMQRFLQLCICTVVYGSKYSKFQNILHSKDTPEGIERWNEVKPGVCVKNWSITLMVILTLQSTDHKSIGDLHCYGNPDAVCRDTRLRPDSQWCIITCTSQSPHCTAQPIREPHDKQQMLFRTFMVRWFRHWYHKLCKAQCICL